MSGGEVRLVRVAEGETISPPSIVSVGASSPITSDSETFDGTNNFTPGPFTIDSSDVVTLINGAFWTIVEKLTINGSLVITSGTVKILA